MASPIFGGFSFAVTDTSSKPTTEIIKLIKQYGGNASYMLNKKVLLAIFFMSRKLTFYLLDNAFGHNF